MGEEKEYTQDYIWPLWMRVVEAFMAFNSGLCDVEKYYLKWLRVLNCVRGLDFKSYVCQICVISLLLF